MEMGMDIVERLHAVDDQLPRILVVAAGDADYVPAVERAKSKGWPVEVWFWSNAAGDLKKAATRFCPLDEHLNFMHPPGGWSHVSALSQDRRRAGRQSALVEPPQPGAVAPRENRSGPHVSGKDRQPAGDRFVTFPEIAARARRP